MTRDQLITWLENHDACREAMDWIQATPGKPGHLWRICPKGADLLWLAGRAGIDCSTIGYQIADRAVRVVAPRALDRAGMHHEARKLRRLAQIVDSETARAAACAAYAAEHKIHATMTRRLITWAQVEEAIRERG